MIKRCSLGASPVACAAARAAHVGASVAGSAQSSLRLVCPYAVQRLLKGLAALLQLAAGQCI